MKYAYITPILKKHNLDSSILSNYRPVSQLSSISKERIVTRHLIDYIISTSIVDCFQSAYLPNRSTDTAIKIVFNEIILSMDNKASCYLVLLDLSSAFDTLNPRILSYRLREIGIHGQVHNWLMSFSSNRIQLPIANCINNLISWISCNSLSLNIIKTESIILSRYLSSISLTHPFLISLLISNTITTLGFTINNALDYSVHITNTVRTANYFLYNIGKARSKLTFNLTKS